ncbi:hypothetical protein RM156_12445 [Pantoea agglomerans]|uniref:hypothetical protein n=1 Tax=Enterobacter agglomerans TaxID=549 RepID=UPI00289E4599|nr:hypothetical protein [Pantoea agglomerans]WNK65691.1 hypothetical protein RM156_12445 [Pantoea agglomerans]
MPGSDDKDYDETSGLNLSIEPLHKLPPSLIKLECDSAEEIIGCLVLEHLKTGKRLTLRELNLMLIARRELTSELHQKTLYNEALLLLTTSASC